MEGKARNGRVQAPLERDGVERAGDSTSAIATG